MKTKRAIGIIGVLITLLTNECRADLNGRDDFSGLTEDTNKWGTDFINGVGILTQTNGQLEFTTSGFGTTRDLVIRPWILNFGSYTQNWEVQIDVSLPQFTDLISPQFRSFGLVVFPGSDPSIALANRFDLDLGQVGASDHDFECTMASNGSMSEVLVPTASTYAALRIAFDADTKEFSAFYDQDGRACGYSWTLLTKTNVDTLWNLTNTNVCSVAVIGNSHRTAVVSSNNVFGAHFSASSRNNPMLRINQTGGIVTLAWATNGPTVHLEFTTTLSPPVCWQVVPLTPVIVNTNFTWMPTNGNDPSGNRFFRLSR